MTHGRSKARRTTLAIALAAGILGSASPQGGAATNATLEAEALSLASGSGGSFADAAASGGKGLLIWSNATASGLLTTPKSVRVVVRARGDQCKGAPKMRVKVDGRSVISASVAATSWTDYAADQSLAAGTHSISIAFTNDYRRRSCDRNLRADVLTFVAAAEPPPAQPSTGFEGESMSLPSGSGQVFSDTSAGGGEALLIWSNATATKTLDTASADRLVVRARGDQCEGAPAMVVEVDGGVVLSTTVGATTWTDHAASVPLAAGTHTVAVSFTNDHLAGCERNLRVDRVSFDTVGPSTPPATTTTLYVDPNSSAKQQADAWRTSRPADAAQMDKIASQAQALWLGSWSGDVRAAVEGIVTAAGEKLPVLVAYNIPNRDCGAYSAGGATSPDAYKTWIRAFADGIGSRKAIVVLEPDALALADCLSSTDRTIRFDLLRDAVAVLKSHAGVSVYIDAGHSRWLSASEAASRLTSAGVAQADGLSLNVSNFGTTAGEISYGTAVSSGVGGKHFVIDTSRNGLGPDPSGAWCNPPGRALGERPALATGQPLVDAYLWVKRPGESDGTCNGGPAAGQWWADYALGLAQRAAW